MIMTIWVKKKSNLKYDIDNNNYNDDNDNNTDVFSLDNEIILMRKSLMFKSMLYDRRLVEIYI